MPQIQQRDQTVESAIAKYQATPGYDNTGYVEYSTVLDPQRRQLSATVQAFAESLSKMSGRCREPPGHHAGGRRRDHMAGEANREGACRLPRSHLPAPTARRSRPGRGREALGVPLAAGVADATLGEGTAGASTTAASTTGNDPNRTYPFYGAHQPGIVTPAQDRLAFATMSLLAGTTRSEFGRCSGTGRWPPSG